MNSVWKVVTHLPRRFREAEIPLLSASMAFSTLLALVPFLAMSFVVVTTVTGMDDVGGQLQQWVIRVFKEVGGNNASLVLSKVLRRLAQRSWTVTSAILLFVTSLKLFLDMELAVNRIWLTKPERSWFKRGLVILGFYFLVPIGLALYAGLRSADILRPIFAWNTRVLDVCFVLFLFLMMNRWLPAVKVRWSVALIGALTSLMGFLVLQSSFTWVTKTVFNYSKVYGSLAALPLLCLWILLTWQILLAGIALAAGLQNPTPRRR